MFLRLPHRNPSLVFLQNASGASRSLLDSYFSLWRIPAAFWRKTNTIFWLAVLQNIYFDVSHGHGNCLERRLSLLEFTPAELENYVLLKLYCYVTYQNICFWGSRIGIRCYFLSRMLLEPPEFFLAPYLWRWRIPEAFWTKTDTEFWCAVLHNIFFYVSYYYGNHVERRLPLLEHMWSKNKLIF